MERGEEAWSEAASRWSRTGYEALPSARANRPSQWHLDQPGGEILLSADRIDVLGSGQAQKDR